MFLTSDDTIYALSSGVGRAAIAVIRLSGPHVRAVLTGMCGGVPPIRQAVLRKLRRGEGAVLDEALVLFFAGPRSETGEDICEFQVHGGRAVVAAVMDAIGRFPGLRPAEPGEFARRALVNGKLSLLEVEGLADLIDAETELQRVQAVEGGGSLLFHQAEQWRGCILDIRAELEAGHDFSDEGDVATRLDSKAEQFLKGLVDQFDRAVALGERGERVRDGFKVAIMGEPNAGKSSLLNAIAGRDVAIVSSIPGTTRDRIDVHLDLNGVPVVISDTAGLQETADIVEQEGIRRSIETGTMADLMLWLSPVDAPMPVPDGLSKSVMVVRTKADLGICDPYEHRVSAVTGEGIDGLLRAIEAAGRNALGREPALLTRKRHATALQHGRKHLLDALAAKDRSEICSEELRLACVCLERLVGRVDVEEVLGAIFSRFCIGK